MVGASEPPPNRQGDSEDAPSGSAAQPGSTPAPDTTGSVDASDLKAALGQMVERIRDSVGAVLTTLGDAPGLVARLWAWLTSWKEPSAVGQFLADRASVTEPPRLRDAYTTLAAGTAVVLLLGLGFGLYVTWGMPTPRDVWSAASNPSYTFVDRKGRVIVREGAQNAPPVELAQLPPHVAQAVLAIEDRRFFQHPGIDVSGLARAFGANVAAGRVVQGGSTLTQQLAKNLFLSNERSFRRKAQEIVLALWLEQAFTKRQLLALYLSRVYFGAGAFGIEAASERYFDKPARDLSLGEAAMLAGLLKAPSRLNPIHQPELAAERARLVLTNMVAEGYIGEAQRQAAASEAVQVSLDNPNGNLGYFRTWIQPLIDEVLGDRRDDFIIETTLDLDVQRAGERAIVEAIASEGKAKRVQQGALLSLDGLGGVRAMVGGVGFEETQFNRTTQARRQPGSSFKFFIYLSAMESGLAPWSVRNDAPIVIGDWAPGNYEDHFYGLVTLEEAFARSLNMVAIQVALEVGGRSVIDLTRRLGVRSQLQNYRSLALGAQEMTLMEMVAAYGAVANGGQRIEPHGIAQIRRAEDSAVVWTFSVDRETVLEPRTVRLMNQLTTRVVNAGTGTRARLEGRAAAGKTGTSNGYRDAWFIGYTPGLATGVWFGNDDFSPMNRVTGGALPAAVWRSFMEVAVRDLPVEALPLPRRDDVPLRIEAPSLAGLLELPSIDPLEVDLPGAIPPTDALPPPGEG